MASEEEYSKKAEENNRVLQNLYVNLESWQGAQKKEVQLKLNECGHLLKDWNVSSVDNVTLPFARNCMEKIESVEDAAKIEKKIDSSEKLLHEIENVNESMKKDIKYNADKLNEMKLASINEAMKHITLDSDDNSHILENECSSLIYERINALLDKIHEQEAEIKKLQELVKRANLE